MTSSEQKKTGTARVKINFPTLEKLSQEQWEDMKKRIRPASEFSSRTQGKHGGSE